MTRDTHQPVDDSQLEPAPLTAAVVDDNALVTLLETESEFEARAVAAALEDRDIKTVVIAPSPLDALLPQRIRSRRISTLRVRAADAQRARADLDDIRARARELDWDAVDVGGEGNFAEPPCRRSAVPLLLVVAVVIGFLMMAIPLAIWIITAVI